LDSPANLLTGIDQIQSAIITTPASADPIVNKKQRSRFDRCHRALRAYFAAFHELSNVPTIQELQHETMKSNSSIASNGKGADAHQIGSQTAGVEIVLAPANPEEFKQQLIQTHLAKRVCYFANKGPKTDWWRADSFNANSHLMGNIKSTGTYRNAKKTGLFRIELSIATEVIDEI